MKYLIIALLFVSCSKAVTTPDLLVATPPRYIEYTGELTPYDSFQIPAFFEHSIPLKSAVITTTDTYVLNYNMYGVDTSVSLMYSKQDSLSSNSYSTSGYREKAYSYNVTSGLRVYNDSFLIGALVINDSVTTNLSIFSNGFKVYYLPNTNVDSRAFLTEGGTDPYKGFIFQINNLIQSTTITIRYYY